MILDKKLIFSSEQAITASAASTDTVDLGATGLDIGQGNPIYLEVWLDTAFDTSANTLTIDLQDGATVNGSDAVMTVLPATATSSLLTPGLLVKVSLPEGLNRHIRLYYTCSAGLTSGKINAFLTIG
jgi:hypothetical protein